MQASSAGLYLGHKPSHPHHVKVSSWGLVKQKKKKRKTGMMMRRRRKRINRRKKKIKVTMMTMTTTIYKKRKYTGQDSYNDHQNKAELE